MLRLVLRRHSALKGKTSEMGSMGDSNAMQCSKHLLTLMPSSRGYWTSHQVVPAPDCASETHSTSGWTRFCRNGKRRSPAWTRSSASGKDHNARPERLSDLRVSDFLFARDRVLFAPLLHRFRAFLWRDAHLPRQNASLSRHPQTASGRQHVAAATLAGEP